MCERLFSAIDIFGIPILFNFSKSKKAKSSFGGFCSIVFLGFVIWSIYNSGYELFARHKPQIIDGTTYSEILRPIEISSKMLHLAFAVEINHSYVDKKFCNIVYYLGSDKNNPRELERCTPEHLVIEADLIDFAYNISEYKCLPVVPEYTEATSFTVRVTCPSKPGREEFFALSPEAVVIFPVNGMTMHNYKNPLTLYFDDDYTPLISNTSILNMWSLSHLTITTDDGWLSSEEKHKEYIQIANQQSRNYRDVNEPGVEYFFSVSQQQTYYSRSYKKIQNVLAEVGGIANTIFTIFLVMITPYARIKFSEAFVNELFDIQRKKGHKKRGTSPPRSKKEATLTTENEKGRKSGHPTPSPKYKPSQGIEMQKPNTKPKGQHKNTIPSEKESRPYPSEKRKASQLENEGLLFPQRDEESNVRLESKTNSKASEIICKKSYTQPEYSPQLKNGNRNEKKYRKNVALSVLELDDIMWQLDAPNENDITPDKSLRRKSYVKQQNNLEESDYSSVVVKKQNNDGFIKVDDVQSPNQSDVELNKPSSEKLNKHSSSKADTYKILVRKFSKPKKVKKVKAISISIFEYAWSFFSKSERLKEKMTILNEGLKTVDERLDILSLLKKMRDIDKIKALLLDKDQLFLFDRIQRPEIASRATHWYLEEYLPYEQIFKDPENQMISCQQRLQDKPEKSEIDQKLINLFSNSTCIK